MDADDAQPSQQLLKRRYRQLILILIVGYGALCLCLCALLAYQRHHRRRALAGDPASASKIILPALEPLLVVLALTTLLYSLYFAVALATDAYALGISNVATEVFYSGRQFVFLVVVVFMLQRSVSAAALRRAMAVTFALSTYTIPVVWLLHAADTARDHFHVIRTGARALILLVYGYAFLQRHGRASKRALSEFSLYATVYFVLLFVYNHLFYKGALTAGFLFTFANLVWGSLCPLVIWRVLQADTDHWRSLGQRAVSLQRSNHLRWPTQQHCWPTGRPLRIELKRRRVVDFAHLRHQRVLAHSATCTVYCGSLRGAADVAVKVYRPQEITEDTVAQFAQHVALWDALRHPNIATFVGICVYPPTIQLLVERCVGSLSEVAMAAATRAAAPTRQQQLINVAYLLDMARAVAFLHSFSPPFVLREIRPDSFLVDAQGTVKLGRLDPPLRRTETGEFAKPTASPHTAVDVELTLSCSASAPFNCMGQQQEEELPARRHREWVEFIAPELLEDGESAVACEATDVYALAVSMYAVLFPLRCIYPSMAADRLQDAIVGGSRPLLPDKSTHPVLATLLQSMWHSDPRVRPTAQHVVAMLESVEEELASDVAVCLARDLKTHGVLGPSDSGRDVVSGEQLLRTLRLHQYVDSEGEALRLGNALMDAGVLHHCAHSLAVQRSTVDMYYFSEHLDLDYWDEQLLLASNNSSLLTASSSASSVAFSALLAASRRRATYEWKTGSGHQRRRPRLPSDATELPSGMGNCACRQLSQRLRVKSKRRAGTKQQQDAPVSAMPESLADWSQVALMIVPHQCAPI